MGKIIDIKGMLGGEYHERKRKRKIDQLWSDLDNMSEEEFNDKHNVVSCNGIYNDFQELFDEDITDVNEMGYGDDEDFEQLTNEDLK